MMRPPESFKSGRLLLRRVRGDDIDTVFEYAAKPENTRFMVWPTHRRREDSQAFIDFAMRGYRECSGFAYMIDTKEGETIGWAGINREGDKDLGDCFHVGFFIDVGFWRRGYATEAAKLLVGWIRGAGLRAKSACHVENKASMRVLEKAGLRREGEMGNYTFPNLDSGNQESYIYST